MLVAYAVASILILRVMISLLTVVLLVRLVLKLVAGARLHESCVLSAIHHDVLTLIMTLIIHRIRIMRRSLGYRRARGRRGIIGIASPATIHWGPRSGQMTRVVVLLIVLVVIEWSSSGLEPVCSICHLTKVHLELRSATEEVVLRDMFRSITGIRGLCVLRFRLEGLQLTSLYFAVRGCRATVGRCLLVQLLWCR